MPNKPVHARRYQLTITKLFKNKMQTGDAQQWRTGGHAHGASEGETLRGVDATSDCVGDAGEATGIDRQV